MKVFNLTRHCTTYSSNAYYIRGEWNTLNDVNTLIDTGRDPVFFRELETLHTGFGKTRVEKVLLTHNHYDHCSNLNEIIQRWHPKVYAFSHSLFNVTDLLYDNMSIRIGDVDAVVIACPGHSTDSVCYYVPAEKALFSGDNQLINVSQGNYHEDFILSLEKIASLNVQVIYPGHGKPIFADCNAKIRTSLKKIKACPDHVF